VSKRGVIRGLGRFFAVVAALAAAASGRADAAVLGAQVDNIAQISYSLGAGTTTLTTSPASFLIEAVRTPSTIEFFRYAPIAPDAVTVSLNGSDYLAPAGGALLAVGPLRTAAGVTINTASPVGLTSAGAYFAGEPVIIGVADTGQNGDSAAIETILANIQTANGDFVVLRLYESGPDTGAFTLGSRARPAPLSRMTRCLRLRMAQT